jgi:hypothetical protein
MQNYKYEAENDLSKSDAIIESNDQVVDSLNRFVNLVGPVSHSDWITMLALDHRTGRIGTEILRPK